MVDGKPVEVEQDLSMPPGMSKRELTYKANLATIAAVTTPEIAPTPAKIPTSTE
jgi:hypothetical protein